MYVKDVVKANMLAFEKDVSGIFNVGTGKEIGVNELFRKIVEAMKVRVEEVHAPAKPGEQMKSCLSYEKIKDELGWEPEYNFESGLKETVEWFRQKR